MGRHFIAACVSHLSASWALWVMSGMSKIMGKVRLKCALGTLVKEERKLVKDKFNGLRFHSMKNTTRRNWERLKYLFTHDFFLQ